MLKYLILSLILFYASIFSQDKWTVLGYFDGDQYLNDCGVSHTIQELTELDSIQNVNTVIQADRFPDNSPGSWYDTRRFKIDYMGYLDYDFNEICVDSTLGELNMGAMETLKDFLIWGVTAYPSERYILVLKDHGGGWRSGICIDETDGDILQINEIKIALEYLYNETGVKMDIVAFDACLMGMIEIAYELKDYINSSVIFSQDFGYLPYIFNFNYVISELNNIPDISSIDATNLFFQNVPGTAITLSAIDVNALSTLTSSIVDFVNSFLLFPDWDAIQTAFDNALVFGDRDSFMDMKLFFESLNTSGIAGATQVITDIDDVIIANYARYYDNPATGLNIFFNHFFDGHIVAYNNIFSAFAEDSRWNTMLEEYSNSQDAFDQYFWDSNLYAADYENLRGYWTTIDNNNDYDSWQFCRTYPNSYVFISSSDTICDDYIVSPKYNISSNSTFKFKAKSDYGDQFIIKLSESGNENASDFNVTLMNETFIMNDWTEYSVELNSYLNKDIYIAIQCVSDGGYLQLNDFELSPTDDIADENFASNFDLMKNYPNPFNPTTTIEYSISTKQHVQLTIYNLLGENIAELVNNVVEPGVHKVNFDAKNLPSGEYYYRVTTDSYSKVKKMILLK